MRACASFGATRAGLRWRFVGAVSIHKPPPIFTTVGGGEGAASRRKVRTRSRRSRTCDCATARTSSSACVVRFVWREGDRTNPRHTRPPLPLSPPSPYARWSPPPFPPPCSGLRPRERSTMTESNDLGVRVAHRNSESLVPAIDGARDGRGARASLGCGLDPRSHSPTISGMASARVRAPGGGMHPR